MIRDILDALPDRDRTRLDIAHKSGVPQYVEYRGGLYIGVHVKGTPHLEATETVGDWSIGKVKNATR